GYGGAAQGNCDLPEARQAELSLQPPPIAFPLRRPAVEPFGCVHFLYSSAGTKLAIPAYPPHTLLVAGDYRVGSTLLRASSGIASQIRQGNLQPGTCGGVGAKGGRPEGRDRAS